MADDDQNVAESQPMPGAVRESDLGWQPFGFSRRKTKAMLDSASRVIEQLTTEVVERRGAVSEAEARIAALQAELDGTNARLAATLEQVEQVRVESAKDAREEVERSMIADALVSAHETAAEIVANARRRADELLTTAQNNAQGIEDEADHVMEQAEIRAHSLVENAARDAENLRAESEQLTARIARERGLWMAFLRRALETLEQAEPASPQPDLEGDLRNVIRATDRPAS
jgi:cell division septum initiation protein DivIVA